MQCKSGLYSGWKRSTNLRWLKWKKTFWTIMETCYFCLEGNDLIHAECECQAPIHLYCLQKWQKVANTTNTCAICMERKIHTNTFYQMEPYLHPQLLQYMFYRIGFILCALCICGTCCLSIISFMLYIYTTKNDLNI